MYVKIYVTYLFTYLYVSVKCPASMGYEMHEGRCMKLYTASVNFENARSQCAEDLGHLYYYKDSVVDMAAVQALLSPMGTWLSLPLPPLPTHTHVPFPCQKPCRCAILVAEPALERVKQNAFQFEKNKTERKFSRESSSSKP